MSGVKFEGKPKDEDDSDEDLEKAPERKEEEEEKQPLLGEPTTGPMREVMKRTLSYGGGLETDSLGGEESEREKRTFGCFAYCEKCGSATSQSCNNCYERFCDLCCCCDRKDMHTPRFLQDERVTGTKQRLHVNEQGKIYQYDHELLLTWRVLLGWTGTIFVQRAVYIILPYVAFLALVAFTACYVGIPHARKLDTARFDDFVNYIKVFIAFMLGLFLNNAFKRWWSSVTYFKRFLVSIKQLMFTMHAIGIEQELFEEIERITICSSYILNEEVHCAQLNSHRQRKVRWEKSLTQLVDNKLLTEEERKDLEDCSGCLSTGQDVLGVMSTLTWIWVGETMSLVRNQPKVAPPMYVRLLFLCQDCLAQVELLKTNLIVQLPFTYVHMLCAMVHIANILVAVSCGLTLGSAMAEAQSRVQQIENVVQEQEGHDVASEDGYLLLMLAHVGKKVLMPGGGHLVEQTYQAFQVLGMQFVVLLFQPLMYQSFLVIAHALCYPYGAGICHMPTETFIEQVRHEMTVMKQGKNNHRNRRRAVLQEQLSQREKSGATG